MLQHKIILTSHKLLRPAAQNCYGMQSLNPYQMAHRDRQTQVNAPDVIQSESAKLRCVREY